MKFRLLPALCTSLALVCLSAAEAKNFRWSSQGDAATMDPQSQNETFNLSFL